MYRCPNCGNLSISGLSQLSPPFDSHTNCPSCQAEVRVKRKLTNYLAAAYMLARAIVALSLPHSYRIDPFIDMVIIVALAGIQIRLTEYEVVEKNRPTSAN